MAITWVLPLMLHYFYAICHSCRQKPPLSCCGRPTANNMVLKISLHHGQQSPGRESGVLLPLSLLSHQQDAMLLAVLDLVLLVLLVPLFFDLESRDLSSAIQSRTIPRARVIYYY